MFLRIDRLQAELPFQKKREPNAAAALRETVGAGRIGEMSTLNNYLFQSFNFRSKSKLRPFYSLVANITAEELGHVELVSNGVALLNNGPGASPEEYVDISEAPFEEMKDVRLAASFLSNGGSAMPMNSNGASWNMDFVTTTGNVILDLLHNFHLECGARLHKLRVYETLCDPTGREVCGYLLVRGGVHATPMPLRSRSSPASISRRCCQRRTSTWMKSLKARSIWRGLTAVSYRFSPNDLYKEMAGIWGNGEKALPTDPPGELEVVDGPPEGGKIPELEGTLSAFTPDYAPEEMFEIGDEALEEIAVAAPRRRRCKQ